MNVKYSVLFGLYNFGLGLGLLNLASTLVSRLWPRPQVFGLGLGIGLKHLASINISDVVTFLETEYNHITSISDVKIGAKCVKVSTVQFMHSL